MSEQQVNNLNVLSQDLLITPEALKQNIPLSESAERTVIEGRQTIQRILDREDPRLLVVIGPCSIHDPDAARDYARRLRKLADAVSDSLYIVMRVYFEKPRTTVGWKGLINDPHLNDSFEIEEGLHIARRLLVDLAEIGLPLATEALDPISPQYLQDCISWSAVGARTTESQTHREMASGLSGPVGFKNGTDGNIKIALDAVLSASQPHHFMAVTKDGRSAIAATTGNQDCHIILRGGKTTNYDADSVDAAAKAAQKAGLNPAILIDASHANSSKNPENQPLVLADIGAQLANGDKRIIGVMVESNLVAGRQDLVPGQPLTYGQSITDGCIDWDTTVTALEKLAEAVEQRRTVNKKAVA